MRRNCSICADTRKSSVINALLNQGLSPNAIEFKMRDLALPVKRETILLHKQGCSLPTPTESHNALERYASEHPSKDLAAMVRDEAAQLLRDGKLHIRAADGLRAQELLDRRAERRADRDLLLNMARLLSGAIYGAPTLIIEGQGQEIEGEEIDDGLAPPHLVAPGG